MKRYGTFTLRESVRGLKAENGCSWHFGVPPKPGNRQSVWNSTAASCEVNRLSLVYDINILRPLKENKPRKTTGAMDISLGPKNLSIPGEKLHGEGTIFTGTNSMGTVKAGRIGKKIVYGDLPRILKEEFGIDVLEIPASESDPMGRVIYLEDILALNKAR